LNCENDAQNCAHTDEAQRSPRTSKQTFGEEEKERDDLEDEQAGKVNVDGSRNKSTRSVNVASVNVDEIVAVRKPAQSKVSETKRQDQRGNDAE